jgi:hypothetical protein
MSAYLTSWRIASEKTQSKSSTSGTRRRIDKKPGSPGTRRRVRRFGGVSRAARNCSMTPWRRETREFTRSFRRLQCRSKAQVRDTYLSREPRSCKVSRTSFSSLHGSYPS